MSEFIYKLYHILNKYERRNIYLMFILMLFAAFFEVLSIGIIIPLINIFFSETNFTSNVLFFDINFLKYLPFNQIIIFLFISILLVFFLKNLYLIFFQWWHTKKINQIKVRLSHSLFSEYLNNTLEFHINNNSSKLIRNNHNEIGLLSKTLSLLVVMVSESLAALAILIFVFYLTPSGFIIAFLIFSLSAILMERLFRKKIISWGKQRLDESRESLKKLIEGFNGIKEIKNFMAEKYFITKFTFHERNLAKLSLKVHVMKYLPKILFEYVSVISFILVFLYFLVIENRLVDEILSILIIISLAFVRLMPAANRFMVALQSFQNFSPSINIIYKELKNSDPNINYTERNRDRSILEFNNSLVLKNINFSYSRSDKKILNKFNISIKQGDSIGIIGKSGKGKTTLINILLGLIEPSSGEIYIDDQQINKFPFFWGKTVGVVSQNIFLLDNTIKNNIAFGVEDKFINIERIKESIKISQLESFIDTLPNGIMTVVGERGVKISGGQLQRLAIARAIYNNPKLIIFDEATNQLDDDTEKNLMDLIYSLKKNITLLIVSHKMSTISKCDKIVNLDEI